MPMMPFMIMIHSMGGCGLSKIGENFKYKIVIYWQLKEGKEGIANGGKCGLCTRSLINVPFGSKFY